MDTGAGRNTVQSHKELDMIQQYTQTCGPLPAFGKIVYDDEWMLNYMKCFSCVCVEWPRGFVFSFDDVLGHIH